MSGYIPAPEDLKKDIFDWIKETWKLPFLSSDEMA